MLGLAAPGAVALGLADQRAVAVGQARASGADGLVAPVTACAGQTSLDAPAPVQEEAMRCMTEFARERAGLPGLGEAEQLDSSARSKSGDILRCGDFSHFACEREFTYWMHESGYTAAACWHVGENLAWGIGEEGGVRSILRAWLRSPGHRQNILGDFDQIGIALEIGALTGQAGTRVWTQHFGSRCS